MRNYKMAFGIIILFAAYISMMVQFMLLSENSIGKSQLIRREILLFIVFIAGSSAVIKYRKEEGEKKEQSAARNEML